MKKKRLLSFLLTTLVPCAVCLLVTQTVVADETTEVMDRLEQIEFQADSGTAHLGELAEITIPLGYIFTGREGTQVLMEYFENPITDAELGYLAPKESNWFVVFEFDPMGYVRDDEKDNLDAGAMMEALQQGQEEGNKARRERGWSTLEVTGWAMPPHYNAETHNLEWAVLLKSSDGYQTVNYNTRLLGRNGLMRVTLVAQPDSLDAVVPLYQDLLKSFNYTQGHRYAEFTQGDKVAEYGLTALVVGGAGAVAAKAGIFKWLWKALVAAAVGAGALFKKFFGKKKTLTPPMA